LEICEKGLSDSGQESKKKNHKKVVHLVQKQKNEIVQK